MAQITLFGHVFALTLHEKSSETALRAGLVLFRLI